MSTSFKNDPEFHDTLPKPTPRRGSRLIEFLAVLAIIGVLVALLLPAVRSSGPAAFRAQCTNNLKQIGLALHNYQAVYKVLPPPFTTDATGRPLHSWRTLILPYLEQESLYRTIDLSKPWNDPVNATALATVVNEFRCPSAVRPENTTTYLAIASPNGCFAPGSSRSFSEITDGTSNTLLVIEAGEENAVPWMAPVDADESLAMGLATSAKLHHAGGTNAGFADGSVRFLKASTPPRVLRALMSISGHEALSTDEY